MKLKKMSNENLKEYVQDLLDKLSYIDVGDMTTFELNIIRVFAEEIPADLPRRGVEEKL